LNLPILFPGNGFVYVWETLNETVEFAALDAPLLVGAAVLRDEERRALEEDEADMEKKARAAICVIKTRLHRRYEHQA
jgi:hypothetical protein